VGILAAAEDDREDDLVLLLEKLLGPVDLGHKIVLADLGAQPEFFVLAVMRVAFVLPLLLLVLELPIVHDAADRRFLLRCDFDEVEPYFAGPLQRLRRIEDAEHGAV
jgi:hypothetical protein